MSASTPKIRHSGLAEIGPIAECPILANQARIVVFRLGCGLSTSRHGRAGGRHRVSDLSTGSRIGKASKRDGPLGVRTVPVPVRSKACITGEFLPSLSSNAKKCVPD